MRNVRSPARAPSGLSIDDAPGLPTATVLAPIWRRVLAQVIDQLVLLGPVVLFSLALGVHDLDGVRDHAGAIDIALVSLSFVYEFVLIGAWGRTVGNIALGTRVVRVDTGGRVLWYSSAIRALVPLAAGVIPGVGQFLSLLVYSRALFDRRRQGWHDRAAGTIVVRNGDLSLS